MNTDIKTWQERTRETLNPRVAPCLTDKELSIIGTKSMMEEIAELRAALEDSEQSRRDLLDAANRAIGGGTFMGEPVFPDRQAPSAPVAPDEQKVELMRSGLALMVELKTVKADHAKVLEDAYSALLWLHRRLPTAYKPLATVDQTIESIGRSIGYDARTDLAERAALSVKAEPAAMLTNEQIDALAEKYVFEPDSSNFSSLLRDFARALLTAAPTPPTTGEA